MSADIVIKFGTPTTAQLKTIQELIDKKYTEGMNIPAGITWQRNDVQRKGE